MCQHEANTDLPLMLLIGYLFGRHLALKVAHSAKTSALALDYSFLGQAWHV